MKCFETSYDLFFRKNSVGRSDKLIPNNTIVAKLNSEKKLWTSTKMQAPNRIENTNLGMYTLPSWLSILFLAFFSSLFSIATVCFVVRFVYLA